MALGQATQLERLIDEVLKSQDVQHLDGFLEGDLYEVCPMMCSQQFLTKLDKLIIRSLDHKDCRPASLGLAILHKCGKNLKICDHQGLPEMIAQGLHKKWFERCKQLWIQNGPQWDASLLNLSEDFFDALMVVHDSCKEGTYSITEFFLFPLGHLAVNPRIYILIQKEAIQKFNLILDKIPVELKKKMKKSLHSSDIMVKLAGHILECGDHDFQTALVESLCRMTNPAQRKECADKWFSMEHVANAFVKLRDTEFETECRKFLNLVNGMQGNSRRVYSYPCLEVYLEKHELLMPADEKLEEFWIDFNIGSHSISFYFALAEAAAQDEQWETICVTANEIQSYSVTEKLKRHILKLHLSEVVVVGAVEGSSLTIHFSSSLDIPPAARSIFGPSKCKGFVGKTSTSVVKTAVKVLMEDNSSQVVPETQVSLGQNENNTTSSFVPASNGCVQEVTSDKTKMSESSVFIRFRNEHGARSFSTVIPSMKSKSKPSMEMVRSCDKNEHHLGEQKTPNSSINKTAPKVDMVPAGVGEEDDLEHNFVPDTQPRDEGNTSSNWNKLSISEMLIMPTQKVTSLPRSGNSGPVTAVDQRQRHNVLTQCLQQGLSDRNRDPPPKEPVALQRKMSDIREDSKNGSSDHQGKFCTLEQQVKRNRKAKGKSKCQVSPQEDATPVKTSAKASTTKQLQDKPPSDIKADTTRNLSSKEKRVSELAGSMVKLISNHYKSTPKEHEEKILVKKRWNLQFASRPIFNVSCFSTTNKQGPGPKSLNPYSKTPSQRKDVFTFHADETLNTEDKHKELNNTSAISSSDIYDSSVILSKTKTGHPVGKNKRHVKKHLFSDTDADYVTSEVSWLKESSRKPKPKVTKYSRPAAIKSKTFSSFTTESPDLIPSSPKPRKKNVKSYKQTKAIVKSAAAPIRRPQRAAATSTKSYKEPDTDESQSESERVPISKRVTNEKMCSEAPAIRRRITAEQSANTSRKVDSSILSDLKSPSVIKKQRPLNIVPETSKLNLKNVTPAEEQTNALKDSPAACQNSLCESPPFERMRSAERSAAKLGLQRSTVFTLQGSPLSVSPNPSCQDTPSPVLLLPSPHIAVNSKGNLKAPSIHSAEKKCSSSKSQSIYSAPSLLSLTPTGQNAAGHNVAESAVLQPQASSPPSSLLSLPMLTSTFNELDNPSMSLPPRSPLPRDSYNHGYHCDFSELSSVSRVSLSFSSSFSRSEFSSNMVKCSSATGMACKKEKSPPSEQNLKPAEIHISGPSFKRRSSPSNFEEDRTEMKRSRLRGQDSFRLKPRKLFASFTNVSAESEVTHEIPPSNPVSCSNWDIEVADGDTGMDEHLKLPKIVGNPSNLCQQFSSELKKKFENRHKMMDVYNKQSLTTIQQHISSLKTQLNKCRTLRLEKIMEVLSDEIGNLEKADTVLKNMEKDLTTNWKMHSLAFSSYQEQDRRRNETLKNTLQNNVCHSLEYEASLFTSQMCLIRKDMKTVQDRLLTQMQEGEIQNVKRGLHALFFP